MSYALFFIEKEYTNDECENITLEEHLHLVYQGSTPDLWDSFDKISDACLAAHNQIKYYDNPCILVDLDDPTTIIETFER